MLRSCVDSLLALLRSLVWERSRLIAVLRWTVSDVVCAVTIRLCVIKAAVHVCCRLVSLLWVIVVPL